MFQVTFLIAVHLLILTHLRFEAWPEMMLMPYLMKNGFELYRDMIVPWTPGLMWGLRGWFWLVGLSVENLKLLTWLLIAGIDILVYLIAAKRWGKTAGIVTLASFLLLQPLFDGNGLWFDLAVVPLLLLAFHFKNPLFLGPAFLIKQSVVWLIPAVIDVKYQILYRVKYLILGLTGAIGGSMMWFWLKGELGDYWFWVYDFTFRKLPTMPGHLDLATWRHWVLALAPFVLMGGMRALHKSSRDPAQLGRDDLNSASDCYVTNTPRNDKKGFETDMKKFWIDSSDPFWWMILSIPFALPRFGLFHFQPSIAFLALEIGKLYKDYKGNNNYKIYLLFGAAAVYLGLSWYRMMQIQWQKPDRFLEPEVYQTAAKLTLETDKSQPVLLVNGPELAYVLSGRLPPKPWLTQFPWFLELPGFQEKLIDKFRHQNLKQVLLFPYQNEGEFTPGSYQPNKLLEYVNSIQW